MEVPLGGVTLLCLCEWISQTAVEGGVLIILLNIQQGGWFRRIRFLFQSLYLRL